HTDHLHAWHHGGTTGITNLAQLCPKHHRLKHHGTWTPTTATHNEPPDWTSPTGRHYKAEHPDWEPPVCPPGFRPAELPGSLPAEPSAFVPAEPPPEEPPSENLVDPADLPADDSLWDDFYAMPTVLPADPSTARSLLHY
ncbi:HNH endonuclease, partial [Pseudarthrobacter sp. R1]|uniref:HNH endonuclease signature motif containing protein n=1 Tax=Pseudarthrobacter sp. R1 TaxID=2944934 RepID=UPI00210C4950